MVQQLRTHTPNTHIGQLTATYNRSSRGFHTFLYGTHTHEAYIQTHTYMTENEKNTLTASAPTHTSLLINSVNY